MNARLVLLLAFPALALAAEPPVPQFRAVTLDDKIQIGYGLAIADVDGDKAPDVLLADKKQFVWYRNPGKDKAGDPAAWTKHILAENLTVKDNVCIAAQDIDGDGKAEIAVGAEWNPGDTEKSGAVFHLQPPADRTQPWTPIKFPNVEPTTHRMRWIKLGDERKWGLVVVPLHGRGNKNGEGAPVNILLYHPPAGDAGWTSELLNASLHMTHNFTRLPLLAASGRPLTDNALLFAGREGFAAVALNGGAWVPATPQVPTGMAGGIGEIRVGTFVNGRQFIATVEPMHGNSLAVYVPGKDGKGSITPLVRHLLTDQLVEGHALACGNLLGGLPNLSASEQIVVGWRGKIGVAGSSTGLAVWSPLDARGEKWRETVIDPDGMACEDLMLADLDGDGRLDIVAAGRATKNVKIYFNQTPLSSPRTINSGLER